MRFIAQLVITALSVGFAAYVVPGIRLDGPFTAFVAAFLLGIVNALVRPVLILLTFPATIITLGLFLLVINASMLALVAWLLPGFGIDGFLSAFLGWVIISMTSWLASRVLNRKDK